MGRGSTGNAKVPRGEKEINICGGALEVTGFVAAHPVQFVIDTGADVAILSYRIYEELHHAKEVKHFAGPDGSLKGLDGQRIEVLGTTTLQMSIGETTVRQHVVRQQDLKKTAS